MTKKKKRKKYIHHSDTFIPKYLFVPAAVGKDYLTGLSILELSYKYKHSTTDIRKRLVHLGVPIRHAGCQPGEKRISKLTPEQIREILDLDEQDITHMDISRKYNVTRERIRQICLQAGHATRRSRMTKSIEAVEVKMARKAERFKKVEQISEAWKRGASPIELAILIWGEDRPQLRTYSKIATFRKQYGLKMFPRRHPLHWTQLTQMQRHQRLMAMSEEWKKTASYKHLQKMFGYRSRQSVIASIANRRRRYPDLFPIIPKIIEAKENESTNNT